jgi:hypothetical protein
MDNLMALDTKTNSLDDARDYIKALAPWIKDDQKRIRLRDEPGWCHGGTYSVFAFSLEVQDNKLDSVKKND